MKRGARILTAIADARGLLDIKRWEETPSNHMSHVWATDCESLYEHLISPEMNSVDNKRLAIDINALRQLVWERDGERTHIVDSTSGDCPRWIDTSTMIADPLTKATACDRMMAVLGTGVLDLQPTPESLAMKARNRESRQKARTAGEVISIIPFHGCVEVLTFRVTDVGDVMFEPELLSDIK